jgi:deazaflavin-dependent oxidoreductase (nitroreductase family)
MPPLLTILAALAAITLGLGVVFVLGMRTKSMLVLRPLFWISKRVMNPAQMRTAGTPGAYASIIRATGRVSGRLHETPVGVIPDGDDFLIALPYGARAQWLQNVLAAGTAELVTEGRAYRVDRPELLPAREVASRFSATDQRLFRWLATTDCLRLRRVAVLPERVEAVAA